MTRAAPPSVFQPYSQEVALEALNKELLFCDRCRKAGRRTEIRFSLDAIGRATPRCPWCDGVAPARKARPDEHLVPQSLIHPSKLLPPCPPGKLRCQSCAKPVEGDERLCVGCSLPGLSKRERAQQHRAREDAERVREQARIAGRLERQQLREASPAAAGRKAGTYRDKRCERVVDGKVCGVLFTPSGPRAIYCEAHR